MKPSVRFAGHRPLAGPALPTTSRSTESIDSDDRFWRRPCYVFNRTLPVASDDQRCSHCRFYLTSKCPHIDEFLDDVDDLEPE